MKKMKIILIIFSLLIEGGFLKSIAYGYNPHPRIYIYSNEHFTPANGVTDGSGTENDPYIIEGWKIAPKIESEFVRAAVMIYNTTAYFIIRNCFIDCSDFISGYARGIEVSNASNGKIENCVLQNGGDIGINIMVGQNVKVIGNKITNFGTAISVSGTDILVSKNVISDSSKDGIIPGNISKNIIITYNQLSNSEDDGIEMFGDVQDVYIAYNVVNNMRDTCIALGNIAGGTLSKRITVAYNEVSGSRAKPEIHVNHTINSIVKFNNIKGPKGIGVSGSFGCSIHHNNIYASGYDESDGSNSWDDGKGEGNYWSNWTSPDNDKNGIVDKPYLVSRPEKKIFDRFPLVNPVEIFSPNISTSLDKVLVYPNPFKPNSNLGHSNIIFGGVEPNTRLPKETTIRIYTIAGKLVKILEERDDDGQVFWNAKDDAGKELAGGIYIYIVITPAGKKYSGKLAIVK